MYVFMYVYCSIYIQMNKRNKLTSVIILFKDRNKNPGEFPPSFFVGAWEGFWWAFVTMTTVG